MQQIQEAALLKTKVPDRLLLSLFSNEVHQRKDVEQGHHFTMHKISRLRALESCGISLVELQRNEVRSLSWHYFLPPYFFICVRLRCPDAYEPEFYYPMRCCTALHIPSSCSQQINPKKSQNNSTRTVHRSLRMREMSSSPSATHTSKGYVAKDVPNSAGFFLYCRSTQRTDLQMPPPLQIMSLTSQGLRKVQRHEELLRTQWETQQLSSFARYAPPPYTLHTLAKTTWMASYFQKKTQR